MREVVGHSHGVAYNQNRSENEKMRDFLASEPQKKRAAAFLEIMDALSHGLTPASAKLLHKRFAHLVGE